MISILSESSLHESKAPVTWFSEHYREVLFRGILNVGLGAVLPANMLLFAVVESDGVQECGLTASSWLFMVGMTCYRSQRILKRLLMFFLDCMFYTPAAALKKAT